MSVWQDIASAPKDGSKFLAYQGSTEEKYYVCWWEALPAYDYPRWMDWDDSEREPTHWMPLPEPPTS